jgi:hypothetical protein
MHADQQLPPAYAAWSETKERSGVFGAPIA